MAGAARGDLGQGQRSQRKGRAPPLSPCRRPHAAVPRRFPRPGIISSEMEKPRVCGHRCPRGATTAPGTATPRARCPRGHRHHRPEHGDIAGSVAPGTSRGGGGARPGVSILSRVPPPDPEAPTDPGQPGPEQRPIVPRWVPAVSPCPRGPQPPQRHPGVLRNPPKMLRDPTDAQDTPKCPSGTLDVTLWDPTHAQDIPKCHSGTVDVTLRDPFICQDTPK